MSGISKVWHPILQRILKGWGHKTPPDRQYPMGLTADQVDSLRQLLAHPSWKVYSVLLERVGEHLLTEMMRGVAHEQYLATCGELKMLERLIELPQVILNKVTEMGDREDARQRISATAAEDRANAFVNTPFWDAFVRDTVTRGGTIRQ